MNSKKFNIGDKITYKSRQECGGRYFYGGNEKDNYVGELIKYMEYVPEKNCWKIEVMAEKNCWKIEVMARENYTYHMLESEFREYDSATLEVSNYSIF